jgi:hypothetical protein
LNTKLALGAGLVILVLSLIGNNYLYTHQRELTARNDALREQADKLYALKSNLESETAELKNQINQLNQKAPKLVTRLGASDLRFNYTGQEIRWYISGEVWNVGISVARNCKLHVTLYQGTIVAKDTYIELGNIDVGMYANVSSNVYYTGNALTDWTVTPEYE